MASARDSPSLHPRNPTSHVPEPILGTPRELHPAPRAAGDSTQLPTELVRVHPAPCRQTGRQAEPGDAGTLAGALPQTTRSADASSTPRELVARQA